MLNYAITKRPVARTGKLLIVCMAALVITLFYSRASACQFKVEGVVTDQNRAPISGAEVPLVSKSFSATRTTDGEGRFAFDAALSDGATLTVRAQGFATLEKKWSAQEKQLSITLAPAALSDQITVTAERAETRLSDTAAS